MNATMTPVRSLDQDRHLALAATDDRARLSALDRLSLRLGLWLLLRGERELARRRDHDRHALALANMRDVRARERVAERDSRVRLLR